MVSPEYSRELNALIDNSGLNQDRFMNRIDELKREDPIVIYGAGGCGRWLLELLFEHSVNVMAFFDSNPEKWGKLIQEIPVYNPEENPILSREGLLIVTAVRSRAIEENIVTNLHNWGYTNIIPYYSIWNNFFTGPQTDIKEMFDREQLLKAAQLWKDQKSIDLFMDAVKFYTIFNHEMYSGSGNGPQYFPDDIPLKKDYSCFIDCGAYTGDTIKQLYDTSGKAGAIIAFEPDTDNFLKLNEYCKENKENLSDQLLVYPCGVWSETTQIRFSEGKDAASAITQEGTSIKQCVALDDVLFKVNPSFIKMDVEGAEVEALRGARELVCKSKPDLAVCLYHKISHLWEIVLLVQSWNLGYDFYIRQHDYTMEIVMYAIVKNR